MTSREDQQEAKAMTTSAQTMLGPCAICGDTNYELSCGGPAICPKCDCGNFDAATTLKQAKVIAALREEIAALRAASAPPATGDVRETVALRANLKEAWAALAMIRETIETLGPPGAVKAAEHLDGPTLMHEADALVEGIRALASVAPGPSEAAIQKSAPVILAPHNSGERDPAVTPDWAGADTAPGPRR